MFAWHHYLLGLLFLIAGVTHFTKSTMYERIIPPYLPAPKMLVTLSGMVEMILGFMLLNVETQVSAAWGIIAILIIFLPIHIYMLQEKKASLKLPKWILILRIPIQFMLMYWAYQYT